MRISNNLLTMIPIFAAVLCAQTPQPHNGWKLVPGGEDLITHGYWENSNFANALPAIIQVTNGVLTATDVDTYMGLPNVDAPRLQTAGDFGVVATIQTAPGMSGMITLTGSMMTGTLSWQGEMSVTFGVDNYGNYIYQIYDGVHAGPAVNQALKTFSTPPTGTLTMEMLHQQGQIYFYFNGVQYGPICGPGCFRPRVRDAGF